MRDLNSGRYVFGTNWICLELVIVVIQPAACDDACVDTVEADDVVGCEKGVEEETDHASNAVLGEDVHTIIDSDPEFNWNGLLALKVV